MESGGAAMAFLLWDKKIKIFLWQKPHKYTMSLTLAKSRIVSIYKTMIPAFCFLYGHTYPLLFVLVFSRLVCSFMSI